MRKWLEFYVDNKEKFVNQLLNYSSNWENFLLLNSNTTKTVSHKYASYETLVACDSVKVCSAKTNQFEAIKKFINKNNDWIFGHFNYDLKNGIENLSSKNIDSIEFPDFCCFVPRYVIKISKDLLEIGYLKTVDTAIDAENVIGEITNEEIDNIDNTFNIDNISHNYNKTEYIDCVNKIKQHILLGDIYELNFCTEFLATNADINPANTYQQLNKVSPAPFSGYYRLNDKYLISSSPERFLARRKEKIISQPIKGTIRRGLSENEDILLKHKLKTDKKERAENIMIVDLVRNDLSKTAKRGSVTVEELCGIYSYKYVHQMISTVVSKLDERFDVADVIKTSFPMGSMTGAPKISAMQLIEKFEKSKRGLYSGCIGYISPEKDFDFNVVIRSILYNSSNKNLSFSVGSAITFKSVPENEYEECLLKAKAMIAVLS